MIWCFIMDVMLLGTNLTYGVLVLLFWLRYAVGASLQNTLGQTYGQRTVPQVYIKGKLLGGADETFMAYQEGSLQQKLNEAGIQFSE